MPFLTRTLAPGLLSFSVYACIHVQKTPDATLTHASVVWVSAAAWLALHARA